MYKGVQLLIQWKLVDSCSHVTLMHTKSLLIQLNFSPRKWSDGSKKHFWSDFDFEKNTFDPRIKIELACINVTWLHQSTGSKVVTPCTYYHKIWIIVWLSYLLASLHVSVVFEALKVREFRRGSSVCKHCWENISWFTGDGFCFGDLILIPFASFQSWFTKSFDSRNGIFIVDVSRFSLPCQEFWYFRLRLKWHGIESLKESKPKILNVIYGKDCDCDCEFDLDAISNAVVDGKNHTERT